MNPEIQRRVTTIAKTMWEDDCEWEKEPHDRERPVPMISPKIFSQHTFRCWHTSYADILLLSSIFNFWPSLLCFAEIFLAEHQGRVKPMGEDRMDSDTEEVDTEDHMPIPLARAGPASGKTSSHNPLREWSDDDEDDYRILGIPNLVPLAFTYLLHPT
jgi:hypothetical protein